MISKSLNFTLRVTVRPRAPLSSPCRPDPLDQGLQFGGHGVEFGEIGGECILGADLTFGYRSRTRRPLCILRLEGGLGVGRTTRSARRALEQRSDLGAHDAQM
jgi:hypothetical protein